MPDSPDLPDEDEPPRAVAGARRKPAGERDDRGHLGNAYADRWRRTWQPPSLVSSKALNAFKAQAAAPMTAALASITDHAALRSSTWMPNLFRLNSAAFPVKLPPGLTAA